MVDMPLLFHRGRGRGAVDIYDGTIHNDLVVVAEQRDVRVGTPSSLMKNDTTK